jgi:HK97 family phage major capsid protein
MPDVNEVIEQARKEVERVGGEAKQLHDQVQKSLQEVRSELADRLAKGDVDPLIQTKLEAFGAEIATKLEAGQKAANQRMDAVETALKRVGGSGGALTPEDQKSRRANAIAFTKTAGALAGKQVVITDESHIDFKGYDDYARHFDTMLRKDDRALSAEAVKALSSGSDPDGGYMVEPSVSARIIEKVYESSPIRQLATVETISGTELEIKLDTDETDFEWVGETDLPAEGKTPQLGKKRIIVHTMAARPKATQQQLEDASTDMAAWLARKTSSKFARGEAYAFLRGTGRGMPRGLLTYADGTDGEKIQQLPTGAAAGFTFEGITGIIYSLKEPYHARASWLMRRTSIGKVMLVKDGDGSFIFKTLLMPGSKGLESMLAGYSLRMAEDVPDLAANSLGAIFGDVQAAYTIVDRLGITTLRDPYSVKPFVEFYTRKRVGGDVVNFEAIKIGKGAVVP